MEITHKKLQKAFKHIHHTMSTLSFKNTFKAMSSVLLEVAQNGVNSDVIDQLNDLIEALIDTLGDELDVAVQAENDDIAYSSQAQDNLQTTIDSATDAANSNQESFDEVVEELEWLTWGKEWLEEVLEEVTDARDAVVASWIQTAKNYDALLARLHADISALEDAETFLA